MPCGCVKTHHKVALDSLASLPSPSTLPFLSPTLRLLIPANHCYWMKGTGSARMFTLGSLPGHNLS